MDLNKTRINPDLAIEGTWVPLDDQTELHIAQWLNKKHRDYLQKALDPYQRAIQTKTVDDKTLENIEIKGIANTVLLGWRGLKDNGVEVEYSVQKAIEYLGDESLQWFRDFVRDQAQDMTNFRDEITEEAIESVGKPSNGGSTGVVEAINS